MTQPDEQPKGLRPREFWLLDPTERLHEIHLKPDEIVGLHEDSEVVHVIEASRVQELTTEHLLETSELKAKIHGLINREKDLHSKNQELERELKILKNPSDGRCMEIGALRTLVINLDAKLKDAVKHWPAIRYALALVIRRHDIDEDMQAAAREAYSFMERIKGEGK